MGVFRSRRRNRGNYIGLYAGLLVSCLLAGYLWSNRESKIFDVDETHGNLRHGRRLTAEDEYVVDPKVRRSRLTELWRGGTFWEPSLHPSDDHMLQKTTT